MKGLLVVLLLLVISGVAGLVVTRFLAQRAIGTGAPHWWIDERSSGGVLTILLQPPGHAPGPPLIVAELDPGSVQFEDQLEDARAHAVQRVIALNEGVGVD